MELQKELKIIVGKKMSHWLMQQGKIKSSTIDEVAQDAREYQQGDIWHSFESNVQHGHNSPSYHRFNARHYNGGPSSNDAYAFVATGVSSQDPNVRLTYIREHFPLHRATSFFTRIEVEAIQEGDPVDQIAERLKTEKRLEEYRIARIKYGNSLSHQLRDHHGTDLKLSAITRELLASAVLYMDPQLEQPRL
jgi:hypothetical protein